MIRKENRKIVSNVSLFFIIFDLFYLLVEFLTGQVFYILLIDNVFN